MLAQHLEGSIFGNKGYLSQALFARLLQQGLRLITNVRKDMKARLIRLEETLLLRRRGLIESLIDLLKNASQIQHTPHRSLTGFFANLLSGLLAYSLNPTKPSTA